MLDVLIPTTEQHAGAAFRTTDLLLIRGWSEFHGLSMAIDLAGRVEGVACDEVVVLGARGGSGAWRLWRDRDGIVLQPKLGAARGFAAVPGALEAIMPPDADALTDIRPTVW